MAKKKKEAVKEYVDSYPMTFETFSPSLYNRSMFGNDKEPSSFNGWVHFKKYKVTIEEIKEPIEVLQERLEKLWLECDNYHQWTPLQSAAASIGYTFKGERGSKKKPRY